MITINNLPLVKAENVNLFEDQMWSTAYFLKPEYTYLPDFSDMDEEDKLTYNLKDIEEGMYLVGLEVISDVWVSAGFLGVLLDVYGLLLDESYPVEQKDKHKVSKTFVHLKFKHVIEKMNRHKYTVKLTKKSK